MLTDRLLRQGLYLGLVLMLFVMASPILARWGEGGRGRVEPGGTFFQTEIVENNTVTPAPVLSFEVEAGHYYQLNCTLRAFAENTATAIRFGVTGPATPAADVDFNSVVWTATNAYTLIGSNGFGFTLPTLLSSQGVTSRIYQINGVFKPAIAGTVTVTVESETAGLYVTALPGGFCSYYYGEP